MGDALLTMGIVLLLSLAGNLVAVSADRAALIASECNLFYGSIDPTTVLCCLAEMSRRHYLPTRDESVLPSMNPDNQPSDRRK
jgi:hypothetical protein